LIGGDGGKSAELEAVDESENGGAAGGDVVVGEEDVEVAERVVDALSGLEALVAGKKGGFEVEGVGSVELLGVREAKRSARGHDSELATAAGGPAALTAGRIIDGIGDGGCGFHFFLQREVGIPHPRVFFVRVANKGVRCDVARKSGKYGT